MENEEKIKANLETVYMEYIDYKNYLKDKFKPQDVLRKEMSEKIKSEQDPEKIQQAFFDLAEKQSMYQSDFIGLQNRLFHTIEAYKDLIEIPQEIKRETENIKFQQIFKIKNNIEIAVNKELLEQSKKAIKDNFEVILKMYS